MPDRNETRITPELPIDTEKLFYANLIIVVETGRSVFIKSNVQVIEKSPLYKCLNGLKTLQPVNSYNSITEALSQEKLQGIKPNLWR